VAKSDQATMTGLVGQQVTVSATPTYDRTGADDIMGDFSSQGPTDVDFRVKPDVVAPGVNVLSSIPHAFCDNPGTTGCWAFFQGTSMATPHLAGTAAVVRRAHPSWDAWQVRSAIVNTADQGLLTESAAPDVTESDPLVTGAGRENVLSAVDAQLALSSVSTSFGAVPRRNGSAQVRTISVSNLTGSSITVPVSVDGSNAFHATASTLTVPAGGSADVTVTFTPSAAALGDNSATLSLGNAAHAVVYAYGK
jgi:minor extracellular serine protease Vpr